MVSELVMSTKMNIHTMFPLWIKVVEKSVDNVEKSSHSRGIFQVYPGFSPKQVVYNRLHNGYLW